MEHREVVRRRRMVRSFTADPVDPDVLERLLGDALRSPSAGNSQGTELLVLSGRSETSQFWDITLPPDRRDRFAFPALLDAPVLVVPLADATRYVERYGEQDKASTGLGAGAEAWPVPYWIVDTAFVTMALLHGVVDAGLGALFFGIFREERAVLDHFEVPEHLVAIGAVAIGHPADDDRPGRSATRPRRPVDEVVHRGSYQRRPDAR